jgi:Tol biopolymer transport system component/tRNA A-37 threonylcarbamoyl transferase component Bud32
VSEQRAEAANTAGLGFGEDATFAHYRIVTKIGTGGMGDVYKAWDVKLARHVALKLLRAELVRDPVKVRRFVQEAQAASALNHPAIVTIYEVDLWSDQRTSEKTHYIAMELVDGESLRKHLHQQKNLTERLEILVQVAEGMAKAHAAGVIHRDLKPDNIMITAEGRPKIVDFGLAKLIQPDVLFDASRDEANTLSLYGSRDGMVLGTVGYMSPEQVEGKPVDHRSDIFSLGCILYECVTGQRAFHSESIVDSLHQILYSQPPPVSEANPDASPELERIIRRCLAKNPDERYQSIKEVAIELREVLRTETVPATHRSRRRWRTAAIAGALGIFVAALALWMVRPTGADLAKYHYTPLATSGAYEGFPAWSPDGKSVAYIAEVDGILQVFVRSVGSPTPTQVTQAARDCRDPFWDPDGNRIYYISLAAERDSLWSVGVGGGDPQVVLQNVYTAAISPNSETLVLLREVSEHGNFDLALFVSSPPGAEPTRFPMQIADNNFASGVLRFSPDGTKIGLWAAVRFPTDTSTKLNRAFFVIPWPEGKPRQIPLLRWWAGGRPYPFSWMPDSRHVVVGADRISDSPGMHLWVADSVTGKFRPLTVSNVNEYYPSVSPDGQKIVFSTEEDDFDLLNLPLAGGVMSPVLSTTRNEKSPAWSPARDEFAYVTNQSGHDEIWIRSRDGEWERPVVTANEYRDRPFFSLANLEFSPDGKRIAYQSRESDTYRVWIAAAAGGPPVPLVPLELERRDYQDTPTWSPDGNWVAFTATDASGTFALWKIRVGAESPPVLIKDQIIYPSLPKWSPRGDWITAETTEGFSIISPDGLQSRTLSEETWLTHTWSRDGAEIFGIRLAEDLHLILARIDIKTGEETFISDLGVSPPIIQPVQSLTLSPDGKTLMTSLARLKGDLWILEGFPQPERGVQKALSRFRN